LLVFLLGSHRQRRVFWADSAKRKEQGNRGDSLPAFQMQGKVFKLEKDIWGKVLVTMEEYLPLKNTSVL